MKIDLHTHTHYSDDAVNSPEQLVRVAKQKGLDCLAVTDHNTTRAWAQVKKAGTKHGLEIIQGEEVKVFHNGSRIGEVIGLFLNDEIAAGEFTEVRDKIKSQGGTLVVVHPFDVFRIPFSMLEQYKKDFDAVEVFNARAIINRINNQAMKFARRNRLAVVAGSDAHCSLEIGNAYTVADIRSAEELAAAIRKRKTKAFGMKTNPVIHTVSTMTKLGLLKKGPR